MKEPREISATAYTAFNSVFKSTVPSTFSPFSSRDAASAARVSFSELSSAQTGDSPYTESGAQKSSTSYVPTANTIYTDTYGSPTAHDTYNTAHYPDPYMPVITGLPTSYEESLYRPTGININSDTAERTFTGATAETVGNNGNYNNIRPRQRAPDESFCQRPLSYGYPAPRRATGSSGYGPFHLGP